jgi:hypothetical protein
MNVFSDVFKETFRIHNLKPQEVEAPVREEVSDAKYIADRASQDANRIIRHIWTVCIVMPLVIGILYELVKTA